MGDGSWFRISEVWRGLRLCSAVWYRSPLMTQVLFSTWTLASGTWRSTMTEKRRKPCLSFRPPQVSTFGWHQHCRLCSESDHFCQAFFFIAQEVQVNQGEDGYYKNQDVSVILSCLWVEHWEIIISSLPWVSSEQITGPASGNHLHTIQYDCTILRVSFLIMICSNLHLLSIYQKGDFPLAL